MLGQGEHAGVVAAEVELQLGVDVEGVCNVVTLDRTHWVHWIQDRVDSDTIDTGAASGAQEVGTIHHRFIATPAPAHCQVVIQRRLSEDS